MNHVNSLPVVPAQWICSLESRFVFVQQSIFEQDILFLNPFDIHLTANYMYQAADDTFGTLPDLKCDSPNFIMHKYICLHHSWGRLVKYGLQMFPQIFFPCFTQKNTLTMDDVVVQWIFSIARYNSNKCSTSDDFFVIN